MYTGTGKSTIVSKICSPRRGLPSRGRCKSLTQGWISLSLYKVVVDYFSPTAFNPLNKTPFLPSKITRRNFSRLFGVDVLWRHRWITSGMGLSHPPGWDNISPDVKIGGYSCLKSENNFFSLLRQEYPPIATSGEMLSHPGGWDNPIPEVIRLWRHRTSTPNNLEKSRLVCVLDIFCTNLDKNEKNNQSPHWGRDEGIPSLCPRFATFTTRQASSWIANLGHLDGIPSSLPQCGVRFYSSFLSCL